MARVVDHVAGGVWLVTGTDVSWVLVADAGGVTLVDTGFPRGFPRVLASLQALAALFAGVVVPGHGPACRGGPASADPAQVSVRNLRGAGPGYRDQPLQGSALVAGNGRAGTGTGGRSHADPFRITSIR